MIKAHLEFFEFDAKAWAQAINDSGLSQTELAQFLGVSRACVHHWASGTMHPDFNHPSMGNFLKMVNLLDLNAKEFFITKGDKE